MTGFVVQGHKYQILADIYLIWTDTNKSYKSITSSDNSYTTDILSIPTFKVYLTSFTVFYYTKSRKHKSKCHDEKKKKKQLHRTSVLSNCLKQ